MAGASLLDQHGVLPLGEDVVLKDSGPLKMAHSGRVVGCPSPKRVELVFWLSTQNGRESSLVVSLGLTWQCVLVFGGIPLWLQQLVQNPLNLVATRNRITSVDPMGARSSMNDRNPKRTKSSIPHFADTLIRVKIAPMSN